MIHEGRNVKNLPLKWGLVPLVVVWFVGTMYALWWFQFKDNRVFFVANQDNIAVKFKGKLVENALQKELESLQVSNQITVVNFVSPKCGCNKFNYSHIKDLKSAYADVRFVTMLPESAKMGDAALLNEAHGLNAVNARFVKKQMIPAAPASAVFDRNGDMVYFGPFSDGAMCGQGNNLVESRLKKLANNELVDRWVNIRGYGCFCDW